MPSIDKVIEEPTTTTKNIPTVKYKHTQERHNQKPPWSNDEEEPYEHHHKNLGKHTLL